MGKGAAGWLFGQYQPPNEIPPPGGYVTSALFIMILLYWESLGRSREMVSGVKSLSLDRYPYGMGMGMEQKYKGLSVKHKNMLSIACLPQAYTHQPKPQFLTWEVSECRRRVMSTISAAE